MPQEANIPTDNYTLIAVGVIVVVAFWLVFSLFRKVFGLVLLAALVIGGWVLWSNPEMFHNFAGAVMRFFGSR